MVADCRVPPPSGRMWFNGSAAISRDDPARDRPEDGPEFDSRRFSVLKGGEVGFWIRDDCR
jgi:hypothetical protein